MNEFQAALGLLQLKYVDEAIAKRKRIAETYRNAFKGLSGISCLNDISGVKHNFAYFPILIDAGKLGMTRDHLYDELKKHNIFGRRYFYPLISQFPTYRNLESARPGKMPIAEKVAEEVICLPIYSDLDLDQCKKICSILKAI